MQIRLLRFCLCFFALSLLLAACQKPYLAFCKHKGKKVYYSHLLKANKIQFEKQEGYNLGDEEERLSYELSGLVQQRTNKKVLFFYPKRWFHTRFDSLKYKHICSDSGFVETHTEKRKRNRLARWALRRLGEKPAILDTALLNRSLRSMENQLFNQGYYQAQVKADVKYKRTQATVLFHVKTGKRYLIADVEYNCPDSNLLDIIRAYKDESILKINAPLDQNLFVAERNRLTMLFRNAGYYKFNPNAISFQADTVNAEAAEQKKGNFFKSLGSGMQGEPRTHIYIDIKGFSDSSAFYPRYKVKQVFIFPDDLVLQPHSRRQFLRDSVDIFEYRKGKQRRQKALERDSVATDEEGRIIQNILYIKERKRIYKELFLSNAISVKAGQLYSYERVRQSLRRMTELDVFRFPRIDFQPSLSGKDDELDCFVRVRPAESQVIGTDFEFNTDNANLGWALNLNYRNRNIFRGGESFVINLEGGFDFNPSALNNDSLRVANANAERSGIIQWINLLDINTDVGLNFPRFLGWSRASLLDGIENPRTTLSLGYRYLQQSTIFRVSSFLGRFGYDWGRALKHRYTLNPFLLNFTLNPQLDETFRQRLERSNRVLLASLQERFFIPSSDFTYTYTSNAGTQGPQSPQSLFFKIYTESAGNFTRLIDELTGPSSLRFVGIDYSQYLKLDLDFRYSRNLDPKNALVNRLHLGAALPLGNTVERSIPFSRRFFLGGPSSMRAWNIRQLGPGRIRPVEGAEFQLGDLLLEYNIEYRRKLNSWISLALFSDIGNVWFIYPQDESANRSYPLALQETGVFHAEFYKELAVATGLGLRLDFSFFIFRLDYAVQVHNPGGYDLLDSGRLRYWNNRPFARGRNNWLIAVGYPF